MTGVGFGWMLRCVTGEGLLAGLMWISDACLGSELRLAGAVLPWRAEDSFVP